jgi:hypothetical protein
MSTSNLTGIARSYTKQDQTSFLFFGLFGDSTKKTKSSTATVVSGEQDVAVSAEDKVKRANQHSIAKYRTVRDEFANATKLRKKLDKAMVKHVAAMKPLCKEYLRHRAEIMGLAGTQCLAAQGRVNAEDLQTFPGPTGCMKPNWSGSSEVTPGTPVTLQEIQCSHGQRQLLCSERIAELERGDPAPGEEMLTAQRRPKSEPGAAEHIHKHAQEDSGGENGTPHALGEDAGSDSAKQGMPEPEDQDRQENLPSMDAEFRQWCHPVFRLAVQPISEALSRATLAPEADDEAMQVS